MKSVKEVENIIRKAFVDYYAKVDYANRGDELSSAAVKRIAKDSFSAKENLRNMLRKHPCWNEEKDCIIVEKTINATVSCERLGKLWAEFFGLSVSYSHLLMRCYITNYGITPELNKKLKEFFPTIYKEGKKKSRVLLAYCKKKGYDKEPNFDKWFASISNEINVFPQKIKIILSINAAHFLTMSNPKEDIRGDMLTSCHSLNTTYNYKNGCVGYARDNISMIAFTVNDIDNEESWNNRKTARQMFMYQPNSGILLQSRMYNANGGTTGQQAESEGFRHTVEEIISECENTSNDWESKPYEESNSDGIIFSKRLGFMGYPDWQHTEFSPYLSIRKEHSEEKSFLIGKKGICFNCGEETVYDNLCSKCASKKTFICEECHTEVPFEDTYEAIQNGERIRICEHCATSFYDFCANCGYYFPNYSSQEGEFTENDEFLCNNCLNHR